MRARAAVRMTLLAAALLAAGCGMAERRAERYRVEQAIYQARKAETEAFLGRSRPDSASLLRLRESYVRARSVAKPPFLGGRREEQGIGREMLHLIAAAASQGARLGASAGRPDLALEDAQWIEEHAEGDLMTRRQADFVTTGALRAMGKRDEAVERMRGMLGRYDPVPPPKGTSQEDEILSVPELMAQIRREEGDEAGALREVEYGIGWYKGLLETPRDPMLQALIRARIVRGAIELNRAPEAMEQLNALDRLVAGHAELAPLKPELEYSRAKIRLLANTSDAEGIAMLQRFARDFPKHALAPRALFESAVYLESAKRFPDALARYREVVALYPRNADVAPVALFREAMLEEATGNWEQAKATLESLPVKYPRTPAAVEAPFTIAMRYYARGDREAAKSALARANAVYAKMIAQDSTSVLVPICRFNILKGHLSLGEWDQALATADEMVAHHPRHPYTGQALLEAARVAKTNRQVDRAAGYLQQYLENFPNSRLAADVRREKDKLLR